jgi:hypothetical protein
MSIGENETVALKFSFLCVYQQTHTHTYVGNSKSKLQIQVAT